jgi:3-deoxy-D-manno-octulosonate 8-phosphate phosphatase (KDO 8-P phosphatase)
MTFSDLYQPITQDISTRAAAIKLLICDIDGVFSDGRIYLGNQGEELKAFNTKDGFGIKALVNAGVEVAVITGRHSQIVQQRMTSLKVKHIYQGQEDKIVAYEELKQSLRLSDQQIAYIGDDCPDLPVMKHVGFAVAVNDAHPLVLRQAHYRTLLPGGFGAVRELTDLIMLSKGIALGFEGTSA